MPFGLNSDAIAGAAARADARLDAAITDVFLPDDLRPDERARLALRQVLYRFVGGLEDDIRRHAARWLAAHGDPDTAQAVLAVENRAAPLLSEAGLLRDVALVDEALAMTRVGLIEESLPLKAGDGGHSSLIVRLADRPDRVVAGAAHALMAADNRRGDAVALPAHSYGRLVWQVAAAICATAPGAAADAAVAEAARHALAAHDDGDRVEAAARRLVVAIDPSPAELPSLLVEALDDRRLALVAALLAHGLAIDVETGRALLIEPDDEGLWVALRALDLSRQQIAYVALTLADADPRRDLDSFADQLDVIAALDPGEARASLAPLTLPRELRQAMRALGKARR